MAKTPYPILGMPKYICDAASCQVAPVEEAG
jgi:hypothetical protein